MVTAPPGLPFVPWWHKPRKGPTSPHTDGRHWRGDYQHKKVGDMVPALIPYGVRDIKISVYLDQQGKAVPIPNGTTITFADLAGDPPTRRSRTRLWLRRLGRKKAGQATR